MGELVSSARVYKLFLLDNSRSSRYSLNIGGEWVEIDNTKRYIFSTNYAGIKTRKEER